MMKTRRAILFILVLFMLLPLPAGERTIPVDIILMIDKSLSMAEPGKFASMRTWVQDQLIGQILINDDWITLYQFYGSADHLLTLTVSSAADRQKIVKTIDSIKPDGQYTDIGLALDTIKSALEKRGTNGRHKIMLLLTDLKQEAPWTSRYAGSPASFDSPYLAQARIIQHDNWYEITLDMDIQDMVVKTSKELFSSIQETQGKDAEKLLQGSSAINSQGSAGTAVSGETEKTIAKTSLDKSGRLPLLTLFVLLFIIISVCITVVLVVRTKRKDKKKEGQTE